MGSSASKASRTVGAASRQYPSRAPGQAVTSNAPLSQTPPAANHQAGSTVRPQPQASASRSEAINLNASDPDFARSLRSLGPVQPSPTMSNSSAFPQPGNPSQTAARNGPNPRRNPALMVLDSRQRLQDEAEREFIEAGRRGHEGRQFLDVYTIRQMLTLRDKQGKSASDIEKALGLKGGVVDRLGAKGVFGLAQEVGRAEKAVEIV